MKRLIKNILERQNGRIAFTVCNPCVNQKQMYKCIFFYCIFPKESMNRLEAFQNVLEGIAPFPDFEERIDPADVVPFIQTIQKRQKINMEGSRTDRMNKRFCQRLLGCSENISD